MFIAWFVKESVFFISIVIDLTLFPDEHFLTTRKHNNAKNSKNSAIVSTEKPIHKPNWPPMSEAKSASCKKRQKIYWNKCTLFSLYDHGAGENARVNFKLYEFSV